MLMPPSVVVGSVVVGVSVLVPESVPSVPVAVVEVVGSVVGAFVSVSLPIPSSPHPAVSSAPTSAARLKLFTLPSFIMAFFIA